MKKCCQETFCRALEEVIYTIDCKQPKDLEELYKTLVYAIHELRKKRDEKSKERQSQG